MPVNADTLSVVRLVRRRASTDAAAIAGFDALPKQNLQSWGNHQQQARRHEILFPGLGVLIGLSALMVFACGEEASPDPTAHATSTTETAVSEGPFVIGALDSLPGVGEPYGTPHPQSKLLAVEEINAAGGINGRMPKPVIQGSNCTANDPVSVYRRLTDVEGIKIILWATCRGAPGSCRWPRRKA